MKSLLVFREKCRDIYSKYQYIITPLWKFLLSFIAITIINHRLGYMSKIANTPIALVAALFCSFMPTNFILVISALFAVLHVYALSMAAAIVLILLIFLLFLLYFRFSPRDMVVVQGTPMLWALKIPYLSPILSGLLSGPASLVSVGTGTILYYALRMIKLNEEDLRVGSDDILGQFRSLVDGLLHNKEMFVSIIAFCAATIIVYFIRRLSVNHAWTIAMVVGAIVNSMIFMFGSLVFDTEISIAGVLLGNIFAIAVGKVAQFFFFNVDYLRTEYAQFEDDEYYYYVKAIPKNVIAKPEKSLKKVSSTTKPLPVEEIRRATSSQPAATRRNEAPVRSTASNREVNVDRQTAYKPRTTSQRSVEARATGARQTGTRPVSSRQAGVRPVGSTQGVDKGNRNHSSEHEN